MVCLLRKIVTSENLSQELQMERVIIIQDMNQDQHWSMPHLMCHTLQDHTSLMMSSGQLQATAVLQKSVLSK